MIGRMQFALPAQAVAIARLFGLGTAPRARITRRFAARVVQGGTRELNVPPADVTVHCRQGEAWITHDGDPRDVFIRANETYVADTRSRMRVHALKDCLVEFELAD